MKTKHLLLIPVMLMLTALTVIAQDAENLHPASKQIIPFGKKLPAPDLSTSPGRYQPGIPGQALNPALQSRMNAFKVNDIKKDPNRFMQQILQSRSNMA